MSGNTVVQGSSLGNKTIIKKINPSFLYKVLKCNVNNFQKGLIHSMHCLCGIFLWLRTSCCVYKDFKTVQCGLYFIWIGVIIHQSIIKLRWLEITQLIQFRLACVMLHQYHAARGTMFMPPIEFGNCTSNLPILKELSYLKPRSMLDIKALLYGIICLRI